MKLKKGSLSDFVLRSLKDLVESGDLEAFSYSAQMRYLWSKAQNNPDVRKPAVFQAVRRLRENGYMEQEYLDEGHISLRLTRLGWDFFQTEEEWDGKYRIVIWDIPERKRRLRDLLRRKLREFEFVNLQKSVWVSKRNATGKLRELINELEMEKWVAVIESDDPWFSRISFHDRGEK